MTLIETIAKNWKLEAKLEQGRYFYNYKEVQTILDNERCYVIGRKGTGKTAICNYIVKQNAFNVFSERLSFKNFPFNELYSLTNVKFTATNQYITLWKYLIYSTVCKLMVTNQSIDHSVRDQLSKMYPQNDIKQLSRKVSEWTSLEFGASVLGYGGNLKAERQPIEKQIPWIDKVDVIEDIIIRYCDKSKYYIVFDELDEDYRDVSNNEESIQYKNLLTSLFKAVQDVKCIFADADLDIMPVVFLRDDIYALLNDSDKNKWSDLKIELEWNEEKIKSMLAYRISQDNNPEKGVMSFTEAWDCVFKRGSIAYGNEQSKTMSTFDFITRSTQLRPRDFIKYIQACCEISLEKNETYVSQETIKYVDRAFSNYLRNEITDEVYPLIPEIDNVFQVISNIRKQKFTFEEFSKEYLKYVELGTIMQKNINFVLDTLFNFSVIGNENKYQTGRHYFKYLHTNMTYNINEKIVLHRGLLKSLQIF